MDLPYAIVSKDNQLVIRTAVNNSQAAGKTLSQMVGDIKKIWISFFESDQEALEQWLVCKQHLAIHAHQYVKENRIFETTKYNNHWPSEVTKFFCEHVLGGRGGFRTGKKAYTREALISKLQTKVGDLKSSNKVGQEENAQTRRENLEIALTAHAHEEFAIDENEETRASVKNEVHLFVQTVFDEFTGEVHIRETATRSHTVTQAMANIPPGTPSFTETREETRTGSGVDGEVEVTNANTGSSSALVQQNQSIATPNSELGAVVLQSMPLLPPETSGALLDRYMALAERGAAMLEKDADAKRKREDDQAVANITESGRENLKKHQKVQILQKRAKDDCQKYGPLLAFLLALDEEFPTLVEYAGLCGKPYPFVGRVVLDMELHTLLQYASDLGLESANMQLMTLSESKSGPKMLRGLLAMRPKLNELWVLHVANQQVAHAGANAEQPPAAGVQQPQPVDGAVEALANTAPDIPYTIPVGLQEMVYKILAMPMSPPLDYDNVERIFKAGRPFLIPFCDAKSDFPPHELKFFSLMVMGYHNIKEKRLEIGRFFGELNHDLPMFKELPNCPEFLDGVLPIAQRFYARDVLYRVRHSNGERIGMYIATNQVMIPLMQVAIILTPIFALRGSDVGREAWRSILSAEWVQEHA